MIQRPLIFPSKRIFFLVLPSASVQRLLDRYLFREVLGPTLVGFLAYTGFMAVRGLVQFSELLVQSEQPFAEAGLVVALSLPHIVVLTLPVAFLLGLLIGIGRLSADSELTALRASGVDLLSLYRPIGLLAFAIGGATLALMLGVVPRTNHLLYSMKLRLSSFAFAQRIQPGVFSPEFAGLRVYAEGASSDRRELTGLIISDRSSAEGERLTLAKRGWLELEEDEGRLWLRVEDAETHHMQDGGARYDVTSFSRHRMVLQDNGPTRGVTEKQIREQTLRELLERAAAKARRPEDRRLALTEVHKKFALPAACLVFGLIGLPLGIVNRRGGRAAGFAVSVAIVLLYYALLATGEARAIEGRMSPALAMWLPNLLLLAFGGFALARVRRDKEVFSLPVKAAAPAVPTGGTAREQALAAGKGPTPRRGPFPGVLLIDRYVARRFLGVFALVAISIATLYVLIDYLEISDDIARHRPPTALILRYYQAFLSPIILDIVPFAFLVAALVTVASLVRSAETTALLAHGVSLHRATAPLLVLAVAAGAGLFVFAERVVPAAASESDRIRFLLKGQKPPLSGAGGSWFRGEGGRFLAADAYDPVSRVASGVTVLQIDSASWRLISRHDAPRARLAPGTGLLAESGWIRTFSPGNALAIRRDEPFFIEAPEAAAGFASGRDDPRQMTFRELARFIDVRRRAGADTAALATGLHQKTAAAASALLLTLVGLPFAFTYGKRGAVAGVGAALFLGLTYLFLSALLVSFGQQGAIPPFLAAWAPNVFFGLGAAWGLLGVRT
ncbi:MAG TPA: LptF/LptG family permease [Thermoanaerobaculia bacterium]|nr:LptF/LptG family permease [Thermoanaerobaculia bacterium]